MKILGVCVLLGLLYASPSLCVQVFSNTFEDWACNYSGSDKVCTENQALSQVFHRILETMHLRGIEHTESEAGMRSAFEYFFTPEQLLDERVHNIINDVISGHMSAKSENSQTSTEFKPAGKSPYPYFAFLPVSVGNVIPGAPPIVWESRCFQTTRAEAVLSADKSKVFVHLNLSGPKLHLCSDYYVASTIGHPELKSFFFHGDHTIEISMNGKSEAERWDVLNHGVRFLLFKDDPVQIFFDIINTVSLFLQPLTHGIVSPQATEHNLYFLKHYQNIIPHMQPRNSTLYDLPSDYIQSGDFIGIVRLDGLDPMLGWAMGSTTGHTVVALRDKNNELFFCESTTNGAYWPINGIQCTQYHEWIQRAVKADYNVVVAPLRADLRARFNASAAWEYFETVRGVDYGYETLLYGWLDTAKENFPCLPPDFQSHCLSWEFIETAFSFLEKKIPVVTRIFRQAWNHHLNTRDLTIPELYMYAAQHNISSIDIPHIPERDGWLYRVTRNGQPVDAPSQVCCVFVCNMWKAGGVFEDINNNINCAEQTNFDLYNLNIFDDQRVGDSRPEICRKQDPDNFLCQLTGKYTLHLNKFNATVPYPHMHETCPSKPPLYERPSDC